MQPPPIPKQASERQHAVPTAELFQRYRAAIERSRAVLDDVGDLGRLAVRIPQDGEP